jgi:hypothetical protein
MAAPKLTQEEEQQTRRSLFLGITIWFLYQNTINTLTSLSCNWNWFRFDVVGLPGLQFVALLIGLAALLGTAFLIYLPWRNWQRFQRRSPFRNPAMLEQTEEDRRSLMAFVAMLLNGFFLLFIIATLVPMLVVHGCGSV